MKLYLNWMLVLLAIALSVICYLRGVQVNELQAQLDRKPFVAAAKSANGDVHFLVNLHWMYKFENLCGLKET